MQFELGEHKWINTKMTNYKLELKKLSQEDLNNKYDDIELVDIKKYSVEQYLNLWQSVGKKYNWSSRIRQSKEEVKQKVFDNPNEIVYEIRHQGKVVGISEYRIDIDGEYANFKGETYAEIAFFGLTDEFQGKGLGKKSFFKTIQDIKLNKKIDRIILQTCQLDSEAALPFYQKCGFEIFKTWNEMENIIYYPSTQISSKI
ncbi:hypothetical protein ABPG72_006310 [Tetrahymena utriculariae]